jgi:hypothetical protein
MPDMSGHDATRPDELHTMTLSELEAHVAAAGVLISRRQLMRHCEVGTFEAKKLPAVNNIEQWFIAPGSVEKGIADIKTLQEQRARRDATRPVMTGHDGVEKPEDNRKDMSGHDATRPDMTGPVTPEKPNNSNPDMSGHDGARRDMSDHNGREETVRHAQPDDSRYVALLERDNEFLREQVKKKDDQISDLSNRFSETQTLLGAMQRMFAPLLGQADPFKTTPEPREVRDTPTT